MTDSKYAFIMEEIWMMTIAGAFQRVEIYKKSTSEKEKGEFRKELHQRVSEISSEYAEGDVSEKKHLENIQTLNNVSSPILKDGYLNFGVRQKVLNLYLKYLWCIDKIKPPPHFPVDRTIQLVLKYNPVISWSKDLDETNYLAIINKARDIASKNDILLAEWELTAFKRRSRESVQ